MFRRNRAADRQGTCAVGTAQQQLHGHDHLLLHPDQGLFGVFDGVGEYGAASKRAARLAAQTIFKYYDANPNMATSRDSIAHMQRAFSAARLAIGQDPYQGSTTATVIKLAVTVDRPSMTWGQAGDSRLFVLSAHDQHLEELSTVQGAGNELYNSLGFHGVAACKDAFGCRDLAAGDRIMLCTDGITGDGDEALMPQEIKEALHYEDPLQAASELKNISRKHDDKTVIVLDIL